MSFSLASPSMVFTFGIHQSTTPFVFSCEIDTPSTPFRKRALSDPSPSGPTRKKRRLRLSLTTSPLSLPFSTPRAPSQPDRTSIRNRSSNAVFALGPSQRVLPRLSPSISASPAPSSSSSSCSLLRRAAVLNRVQQRVDAACQRNPNLRWEKEQRQEREMLLKERVEMQRMAALKDGAGLLSSVTSTRPVASPAPAATVQYLGPCQRATAARHGVDDCGSPHDGCDVGSVEDGVEEETNAAAAAAATLSCCFSSSSGSGSIKNSYPTPPPSAVGLSNYDALDSEEHGAEEDEKDDGGVPPQQDQQQSNEPFHHSDEPPVVDEGMRDIFDFLTPPALHQSFLSDFDGEAEAEADRGVGDLSHSPPDSIPVQVPVQIHAHPNNDDNNDGIDADDDPTATNPPQPPSPQCQAPAVATPTPSPAWAPRVWRASLYRCHHYHLHHSHFQYHLRDRHGHGHGHERQHYCAMAAAFVAVPRAH